MRFFAAALGLFALGASLTAAPAPARADTSSWLAVGGGAGLKRDEAAASYDGAGALSFSLGVGTSPLARFVGGGLIRSTTYFGLGTDLSLALRAATGGYARGAWGLAIDVGPALRTWARSSSGRAPLQGMVWLGAPWGLGLGLGGEVFDLAGKANAPGLVALLEVDLLRLTVMRQGTTDHFWENPLPAGGRMSPSSEDAR
ncbi:MAG: hypothetical protein R3B36_13405 [Polyangiaceae bacterium]